MKKKDKKGLNAINATYLLMISFMKQAFEYFVIGFGINGFYINDLIRSISHSILPYY